MSTERNSSRGRQQGSKKPASNRKTFESRDPNSKATPRRRAEKFQKKAPVQKQLKTDADGIRLNKYISNSGICSRREADVLIAAGSAMVNGKVITEMGFKVQLTDEVRFDGSLINPETKRYVLLNKPKNYITTMDDERGRKTVMELSANGCQRTHLSRRTFGQKYNWIVVVYQRWRIGKKIDTSQAQCAQIVPRLFGP